MKKLYFWVCREKKLCIRNTALGLALIAGFAVSGAAQALTQTQTQTLNSIDLFPPISTSFSGFNIAGATLTGVALDWDLTLNLDLSADFCALFGDCTPSIVDWAFSGQTGAFGSSIFEQTSLDYGFNINTDDLQIATNQMLFLNNSKSFSNFSDFLGAGSIGAVENFWATQAGYVFFDHEILTGNIHLTYTYSETGPVVPAPTPTTLAMLGLGLIGIFFQRQRKTVKL
jgi:hypothetical protein